MASTKAGNPIDWQPDTFRPSANFEPSLWGDRFSSFHLDNQAFEMYSKEVEVLKEEVRSMLIDAESKASEKMNLINTIERLGVFYHFEKEIEEKLEQIFHSHSHLEDHEDYNDLSTAAIHFRIFRQHGYNMSCDVFNKFKDNNGKFNENLTRDVMGMLSLYEASHLRINGEDIIDEALAFTTTHLESMVTDELSPFLAKQVMHALEQPLHKGIPRLEARRYISIYEEDVSKNKLLLKLAKFDFNLLQLTHKQELCHMSRWWNDLGFESKLPFVRSRVVECYFWAMTAYFEPHYSLGRIILAKIIVMSSVLNDIYDEYGTIEELKLFTDAMQRAIINLYEEFDKEMTKQGRSYSVDGSKYAFKEIARSYHMEAKWCKEGYVPSFDEFMSNALNSVGYYLLTASSFVGMGAIATTETFGWIKDKPKILVASRTIVRLMDDIVDYEEDLEKGHVATGIICYMKEHAGMSKEEPYGWPDDYRHVPASDYWHAPTAADYWHVPTFDYRHVPAVADYRLVPAVDYLQTPTATDFRHVPTFDYRHVPAATDYRHVPTVDYRQVPIVVDYRQTPMVDYWQVANQHVTPVSQPSVLGEQPMVNQSYG
ncbi:valerianol synthase TPS8-like [Cornus florida]|uniref:valerianol synthase TPS8-like n=1 Tax=Cornus florida TaxID=4283 RepID=UPI002896AE4D|nr:valerianol synthase TPS8-like [Cornus florida]